MKIAFVASEVYPLIKTGGLADVAYALPKELTKIGHELCVFLPKYSQLNNQYLQNIKYVTELEINHSTVKVFKLIYENVLYYLIDEPNLFCRESLYENYDRDYQFAFLCEAVLRILEVIQFKADIIHCNDWQTGLIPFFLLQKFSHSPFYRNMKSVYTIHNLRFQGEFSSQAVRTLGYEYHDEFINYMKLGIIHATQVNTVSKTYANEILTDFYGERLNHVLESRKDSLCGIVNGIDVEFFNPETDVSLVAPYKSNNLETKSINKLVLQTKYGLTKDANIPLIGLVTRLDSQKGLDLVSEVIEETLINDHVQYFILGSGEKRFEQYFQMLRDKYPTKLAVYFGYNENLAHLIYGASDMFLMPSLYEPCGLSQLISLRYGTVPIVRETGGLNDTVLSFNPDTREGNGFTFANYNAHDMLFTIRRALQFYYQDKGIWQLLMLRGMQGDYSWKQSATEYEKMYENLIRK